MPPNGSALMMTRNSAWQSGGVFYYAGWWEGGPTLLAIVNLDKWNALPKYYQNVLEQAGHYANNWMMAKYDQRQSDGVEESCWLTAPSCVGFSPEIMEASFKAAKVPHREVSATNANFKKLHELLTSFSNNGYQWFQVAEVRLRQLHGASLAELIASQRRTERYGFGIDPWAVPGSREHNASRKVRSQLRVISRP